MGRRASAQRSRQDPGRIAFDTPAAAQPGRNSAVGPGLAGDRARRKRSRSRSNEITPEGAPIGLLGERHTGRRRPARRRPQCRGDRARSRTARAKSAKRPTGKSIDHELAASGSRTGRPTAAIRSRSWSSAHRTSPRPRSVLTCHDTRSVGLVRTRNPVVSSPSRPYEIVEGTTANSPGTGRAMSQLVAKMRGLPSITHRGPPDPARQESRFTSRSAGAPRRPSDQHIVDIDERRAAVARQLVAACGRQGSVQATRVGF